MPTLIIVNSHIGFGAPHKQDTSAAHGEPLGEEEVRLAKRSYGWPEEAHFLVPSGVREYFDEDFGERGRRLRKEWDNLFIAYRKKSPELADQIERMQKWELPEDWNAELPEFPTDARASPRVKSSGKVFKPSPPVSLADRWFCGSCAVHKDAPLIRGSRRTRS